MRGINLSMWRMFRVVLATALIFTLSPLLSTSDVEASFIDAVTADNISNGTAGSDLTRGWEFTTNSEITVMELGIWVSNANGQNVLNDDHLIRIWDTSDTSSPLVSTTILAGNYAEGAFAYKSVTPTLLSANTNYVIAAYYPTASDFRHDNGINGNLYTFNSALTPLGGRSAFSNAFPSTSSSSELVGPTFRFETAASTVPEPSSFALFGLGALGMAVVAVRRRRKLAAPAIG